MRNLILPALLALSACSAATQTSVATASAKAVIAGDESYVAAEKFGASLVAAGQADKAKIQALNQTAYTALVALRAAQATGTSTNIATATANLSAAIAAIYALKGN